jgi:hypothetical protein
MENVMTKNTILGLKGAMLGLLLVAGTSTVSSPVQAVTLAVDNLTTINTFRILRDSGTAGEYNAVALSFTTGSAVSYLSQIDMREYLQPGATANFVMSLYADGASAPGALIETLTGPVIPSGTPNNSINSYTPAGLATLAAATTYWVVGTNTSTTDAITWRGATGGTEVASQSGWSMGSTMLGSTDFGTSWTNLGGNPVLMMGIYAEDVPEPEAIAGVLMAGVLGLLGMKRRRRLIVESKRDSIAA